MAQNNLKKVTGREPYSKRRIIVGVAIILVALLLCAILIPMLARQEKTYNVLLVKKDIAAGTLITEENLDEYLYFYATNDGNYASLGIFKAEDVINKYVIHDMNRNSVLKQTDVSATMVIHSDKVPAGKELVAVAIGSIETDVGYMPRAEDIIRVYGIEPRGGWYVDKEGHIVLSEKADAFVYDLLKYVRVYSCLDSEGISIEESGAKPATMVLVCTTSQVEQLIEAQNYSKVYFSLISSGNKEEAESLLALQEKDILEHDLKESQLDGVERHKVVLPLSAFTLYNGTHPFSCDYVTLSYVAENEFKQMDENGNISTVTKTELVINGLLMCVKVSDIYDDRGVTVNLIKDGESEDEHYPYIDENHSIALWLSDEQEEYLASVIKGNQMFLTVLQNTNEEIEAAMELVDAEIRKIQVEKLTSQDAETGEEEVSEGENGGDEV